MIDGLDSMVYDRVLRDFKNSSSEIYTQTKGAGDDVLRGGKGNDWLMGGGGNDTFVWKAEDVDGGTDYLVDFASGDKLDVLSCLQGFTQGSSAIGNWIRLENGQTADNLFGSGSYSRISIDVHGLADFAHSEQTIVLKSNPFSAYADASALLLNAVLM